jgi:hypothetical protein
MGYTSDGLRIAVAPGHVPHPIDELFLNGRVYVTLDIQADRRRVEV